MTLRRSVLAALCAFSVASTAPAVASTPVPATLELSAAGKRALKSRSLSLATIPQSSSTKLRMGTGKATIGSTAKLALDGTLQMRSGSRKLNLTGLSVTLGRTSSFMTAKAGKETVRLFTITPTRPTEIDAARQRVVLSGARIALTGAAATRIKSSLRLKRSLSTAALGTLSILVEPPPQVEPAPPPLPAPAPAATATPTPVPTPEPETPCAQRFAATPAGSVDWFGCDLPGSSDLRSWTNYVQTQFPPFPCPGTVGTVTASGGATRIVAATAYDHRFPIATSAFRPDGSATIAVTGTVGYGMPVHGIEESIGTFRIEIAAGGRTGTVYAGGAAKPRVMGPEVCTTPPVPYANQPVLTLDLAAIAPVSSGGVKRWVHVPARIAAGHELIGGGTYAAGSNWGAFTIAVPER